MHRHGLLTPYTHHGNHRQTVSVLRFCFGQFIDTQKARRRHTTTHNAVRPNTRERKTRHDTHQHSLNWGYRQLGAGWHMNTTCIDVSGLLLKNVNFITYDSNDVRVSVSEPCYDEGAAGWSRYHTTWFLKRSYWYELIQTVLWWIQVHSNTREFENMIVNWHSSQKYRLDHGFCNPFFERSKFDHIQLSVRW